MTDALSDRSLSEPEESDRPVRPTPRWRELFDVPRGPRTAVSAAVARPLFDQVAARFGLVVLTGSTPPPGRGAEPDLADVDRPVIWLRRPEEFYARVGRDGLIGFGEAYMTGAWDSPDLARLLTVLAREIGTLVPESWQRFRRAYVARHPRHHRNTTRNSRQNIADHYDLSNDLFAVFLDDTLTYSSALFPAKVRPGSAGSLVDPPGPVTRADLSAAQLRKIERLLDAARVGPGTRLLEIGTGWGELALRAAARGARVRSVTLSSEQAELARRKVAGVGLGGRVDIELLDYRRVEGRYDAVVSVEMIEAVGYEYLPTYYRTLHDRLAPGGRAAIQAIVMPHQRMLATLGTFTWIHKYIFPGGFLPSLELLDQTAGGVGLDRVDSLSFGQHYAETLRLWDEAFWTADPAWLQQLGFDEVFRRMWHFYLTYSRAGFASDYLDVCQLVYRRREDS